MSERSESKVVVYARSDEGLDSLRVPVTDGLDLATTIAGTDSVDPDDMTVVAKALADAGCAILSRRGVSVEVDMFGRDHGFDQVLDVIEAPFSEISNLVVAASDDPEVEALIDSALVNDVRVHIVPGPWFDGGAGGSMGSVLSRRAGVGEEWSGRPPLGFDVSDGHLVKDPDFGDIVGTLRLVQRGKLSKRSAADELDTSRRTINRCLENPERYGLPREQEA